MVYAENDYIRVGYKYEKGHSNIVFTIRSMLDKEKPHDRTEARRLITLGRLEALQSLKFKKVA